ncbi:MAG: hypothetical protein JWR23_683, partial [Mucilaginibacter sp.]|nr:hypothetical protein [Mucilaginibacter sp.]
MKTIKILMLLLVIYAVGYSQDKATNGGQFSSPAPDLKHVLLPNGWSLTPAGRSLEVGDLPLNIAVSATGRLMAVSNNGQGTQSIQLIDAIHEKVLDNLEIPKSFYGLK